jgi:hypothetical protein
VAGCGVGGRGGSGDGSGAAGCTEDGKRLALWCSV